MRANADLAAAPLIAELMALGPWGSVIEIKDTLVCGQKVLELGRQKVIDTKDTTRLVCVAWVISPDIEGYRLLLPSYAHLYDGVLPSAVFSDISVALKWSEEQVRRATPIPF